MVVNAHDILRYGHALEASVARSMEQPPERRLVTVDQRHFAPVPEAINMKTLKSGSKAARAIQVSAGHFFEAFDLIVFGTFAKIIADNFFSAGNDQLGLMLVFTTFASAYVMRFFGAVFLGPYFDHAGRRKGLLVSLTLMAIGTGIIAVAPTYRAIGVFAPMLIIFARLIQGFSMGAETGGVYAYLLEIASPGKKALFVSFSATTFGLCGGWYGILSCCRAHRTAAAKASPTTSS
jgi:MFS family permease